MPEILRFRDCERCGAIVGVKTRAGGGIDNEEAHIGWHEAQDELLTMLATNAQASFHARLASLIKFLSGKR